MRPGTTSTMRALPCTASVMTPACWPVKDLALTPRLLIAIASSDIEMRSPAVRRMSISRDGRERGDLPGEVESSSVVSPMAETTTTTSLPGLACLADPLGDALDALGVGDRRAAVLLHDECHCAAPLRSWSRRSKRPPGAVRTVRVYDPGRRRPAAVHESRPHPDDASDRAPGRRPPESGAGMTGRAPVAADSSGVSPGASASAWTTGSSATSVRRCPRISTSPRTALAPRSPHDVR